MSSVVNVLFTSVGRRVELLKAFRRAFHTTGLSGRIVGTECDPLAPALRLCDEVIISPHVDDSRYVNTLLEICSHHRVGLVFPLIDPDIPILSSNASRFAAIGARVAVVGEAAAAIAADKTKTFRLLMESGVATPKTWFDNGSLPSADDYPVYIKPRNGSAANHAHKVCDSAELEYLIERVPDPIIQEFLPGPEVTCDLAYSFDGRPLGMCQRKRIAVRAGEVQKAVTVWFESVADGCMAVGERLGAVGPITIQCIFKQEAPYFTEINARFGGGLPLALAAGLDYPSWYLLLGAGQEPAPPPIGSYTKGLYMTRFDESFFLKSEQLHVS